MTTSGGAALQWRRSGASRGPAFAAALELYTGAGGAGGRLVAGSSW